MKLVICTKFQVNRMNCVESRRGVRLTPPPLRLRVTIFSRRLLGLTLSLSQERGTVPIPLSDFPSYHFCVFAKIAVQSIYPPFFSEIHVSMEKKNYCHEKKLRGGGLQRHHRPEKKRVAAKIYKFS